MLFGERSGEGCATGRAGQAPKARHGHAPPARYLSDTMSGRLRIRRLPINGFTEPRPDHHRMAAVETGGVVRPVVW